MFGVTANTVSASFCTLIVLLWLSDVEAAVIGDFLLDFIPESADRGRGDGDINEEGEEKRDGKEGDEEEDRDVVGTLRLAM